MIKIALTRLYTLVLKYLYPGIQIGDKCRIDYRVDINNKNHITLKDNTTLYKNITIYKDNNGRFEIGYSSHIAPYGYFLIEDQQINIGNNVAIGPFCSFFCVTNHISEDPNKLHTDTYQKGTIVIGNNVFIGTHCVILPNTIIENNTVIAANSTVKGTLKEGWIYGGNPAKPLKELYKNG
ncbi:acyltransferase [Sulfuricurvum sp.]|uniref:acyltransferase n=1 Tax=Sulfuricurvum sp. TaxID=2025608 RepID=UPI002D4189BF|nr:acyltransferase [Sulfuricurvum sp.]HZF70597.1 acyltransferase [Sulfuricurvum sp.]